MFFIQGVLGSMFDMDWDSLVSQAASAEGQGEEKQRWRKRSHVKRIDRQQQHTLFEYVHQSEFWKFSTIDWIFFKIYSW